jgi:RNA polymerase sigma-70 factor (ECF subfamily)
MAYGPDPADFARLAGRRLDFAAVYRDHFDYVWTCLRRFGVADSALDDAAQEVFVVVHRRLDEFAGRAAVRTWLFAIARRIAFRFRRSAQRAARRHDALAHRQVAPSPPDPDDAIRDAQARRRLHAFLDQLDDDKRAAFLLGELEGLGREELGRALGINPNTAYARLRAARLQFHRQFESPDARAAVLACGRDLEPAPEARRHRVWLLLGLDLDLDATSTAAAPASASFASGVKLVAGVAAMTVLSFLVQRTGPSGHLDLAPPGHVAPQEPGSRLAAGPEPRSSVAPAAAFPAEDRPASTPLALTTGASERSTRSATATIAPRSPAPAARQAVTVRDESGPLPADDGRRDAVAQQLPGTTPPPLQRPRNNSTPAAQPSPPSMAPGRPLGAADTSPADLPLAADVRLLGQARRALADDRPAAALTHLEHHARRFPASPLRAARHALRVTVLCRLGERAAAEREAAGFLREHPDSGLAEQVRGGCDASPSVTNPATAGD